MEKHPDLALTFNVKLQDNAKLVETRESIKDTHLA